MLYLKCNLPPDHYVQKLFLGYGRLNFECDIICKIATTVDWEYSNEMLEELWERESNNRKLIRRMDREHVMLIITCLDAIDKS